MVFELPYIVYKIRFFSILELNNGDLTMPCVIGVSGGVDSMYLLHCMSMIHAPENLIVAHVNYHYRKDSTLDELNVKNFCKAHRLKCFVLNAPPCPRTGFEEWARNVRYEFFKSLMDGFKTSYLYLGHNANDQAETVLMNRQRGCGLYGEGGMRAHSRWGNYIIKRVLLNMTKKEIYEQAVKAGITWREDSTNSDTKFLRNSIRATMTDDDVIRINEDAKKAVIKYELMLSTAHVMYRIESSVDSFSIDKPREIEYWNIAVYDMLRLDIQLTRKHFDLLHSDAKSTNVVNLPSGWRVNKRKKNRVHFTKISIDG